MAVDVRAIREGLASVITAGSGLRMFSHEQDVPKPPCGYVVLGDPFMVEPHEAFRDGLCQIELVVRILGAEAAGVERGLKELDQYLGSGTGESASVIDAIYADTTLDGAIPGGNVRVIEIGAPRDVDTLGGVSFIGVDIPLRLYVPRT